MTSCDLVMISEFRIANQHQVHQKSMGHFHNNSQVVVGGCILEYGKISTEGVGF